MRPPTRVLVADDHPEMLAAIISVLEHDDRFVVVGTARNAEEARCAAAELSPDVALVDVHMPGGGVAAAELLAALPRPPVVVAISAHSGSAVVEDMLRVGAVGYLTKGRIGDTLPDVLARCAEGEVVLATPVAASALRSFLRASARA